MIILTYKDHTGNLRNWEAVERVNCNGVVAIIPVTKEKELLFVRQFRPVVNNFVIEFPAGLNDKGESSVDAAKRELIEETGYTAEDFISIAKGPLSSGMSAEMMEVFLAKNAYQAPMEQRILHEVEETESIDIIKTPMKDAYYVLDGFRKKGDLIDLKIYGFIELARAYYSYIKES
ncbi:MAG: NUDIX hydrolase [Thermodesulfovibrionales bacterium]|nr:NUDIX hydrolase [Thermodesulfovibrionales bacterium]